MNLIKKVDEKLKAILAAHGITDPKEQQTIIIKFINAFTGR
jgi:hypothetical protein